MTTSVALRELADLIDQGHPADAISVGAHVTVICTNPLSAARWQERTPNELLPISGLPVAVVLIDMYEAASS